MATQGQRRINFLGGIGVLFIMCTAYIGMNYVDIHVPKVSRMSDQLVFAIRWIMLSLLPMIFGVLVSCSIFRRHIVRIFFNLLVNLLVQVHVQLNQQ